jgi:hypothetical protein
VVDRAEAKGKARVRGKVKGKNRDKASRKKDRSAGARAADRRVVAKAKSRDPGPVNRIVQGRPSGADPLVALAESRERSLGPEAKNELRRCLEQRPRVERFAAFR